MWVLYNPLIRFLGERRTGHRKNQQGSQPKA